MTDIVEKLLEISGSFADDLGDDDYMRVDILEAAAEIKRLRSSLAKIHSLLEKDFGGFYRSAPIAEPLGKIRAIMLGYEVSND